MNRRYRIALAMSLFVAAMGLGIAVAHDVLNPQFTPEKGSFDKPHGQLGEKPGTTWSVSTMAASVKGKPNAGKVTKLVGEIVDYSCYLQLGKHGGKHRDCGQKCVKNGQPIGLLTKDGKLYLLMDEEHDQRRDGLTTLRKAGIEHMAHIMEVNGTVTEVAGQRAMYVQGFVKK